MTSTCSKLEPNSASTQVSAQVSFFSPRTTGHDGPLWSKESPFLFVTDLDDTLVGDAEALKLFNKEWGDNFAKRGCKLIYNTGRSLKDYQALCKEWALLVPDIFIGGCGTQIFTFESSQGTETEDEEWSRLLQVGWHKAVVSDAIYNSEDLAIKVIRLQTATEAAPANQSSQLCRHACDHLLRGQYGAITEKRESMENPLMFSVRLNGVPAAHAEQAKCVAARCRLLRELERAASSCRAAGSMLPFTSRLGSRIPARPPPLCGPARTDVRRARKRPRADSFARGVPGQTLSPTTLCQ